jgi:hypothetical protein
MYIKNISKSVVILFILLSFSHKSFAQVNRGQLDGRQNTITTAVPFLMITPDARAGAMGDAGVASPNDMNAIHWNAAKLAFMEKNGGISLSYTPWLRSLVPDVSLSYLSFYNRINDRSTIGGSLRYFSLGSIDFTDDQANPLGTFTPNELALDMAYAQKLSENFSVGVAFRYIRSNLTGGLQTANGLEPANTYAADITSYYNNKFRYKKKWVNYGYGVAITNIGAKVTYTTAQFEDFIPINLRVGGYLNFELDKYNSIAILLDFNKLLVPTPPVYETDANGNVVYKDGEPVIKEGKADDVPVVQGMIQSFYDAPGGVKEELQEINTSFGLEYWYDKQFALRGGFFYEPESKGNRQYATLGAGLRYNVFTIDVSYLFSFGQRNPLDNTLRFTLGLDFAAFTKKKEKKSDTPSGFSDPDR